MRANIVQYKDKRLCQINIIAYLMSMKDPVGCRLLQADFISILTPLGRFVVKWLPSRWKSTLDL